MAAQSPHDALFKGIFSRPDRAAELLRALLRPEVVHLIDWDSLALVPGSFVDETLRSHHADLLFTARMAGQDICIYKLLEHKSSPDEWVGLALSRYMNRVWVRHREVEPEARRLPPILPVVVHHADRGWTGPTEFSRLVDVPPPAELLLAFTPRFHWVVVDLAAADDAAMAAQGVSPPVRLTLRALTETRKAPDVFAMVHRWVGLVREIFGRPDRDSVISMIFEYLYAVRRPEMEAMNLNEALSDEHGAVDVESELTPFQQWIVRMRDRRMHAQGHVQGHVQGQRDALLSLLRLKFSAVPQGLEVRVRAADEADVGRWLARVLTAASLDEVFAD